MPPPMIPFLLSWMIPPPRKTFEGNLNAGYLAQSGNTKSSSLTADTAMTWYGQRTAWSLWGNASNTSSNDERSSEKYAVGARNRFNMTDYDYTLARPVG